MLSRTCALRKVALASRTHVSFFPSGHVTLSDLRLIHATTFMAQVKKTSIHSPYFINSKSSIRALLEIFSPSHIHFKCGTLLPRSQNNQEASEQVRRLYQRRYALLTIPRHVIKKYLRCGPSDQESYYKARKAFRKVLSKNFTPTHDHVMKDEKYRESQLEIGWRKETCIPVDVPAQRRLLLCNTKRT